MFLIDTNNDSGFDVPIDNFSEDFYENDNHFGKYVDVNDSDIDFDGVIDFFDFDGIDGANFVPITVQLSENLSYASLETVTLNFEYDDASLNSADGLMRIWMQDADQARSAGDFLSSGQTIDVTSSLQPGDSLTFYVEGVQETNRTSLSIQLNCPLRLSARIGPEC